MRVDALLFDKDGTLFDFQATWAAFGVRAVTDLSGGDDELLDQLRRALRLEMSPPRFLKDSVVIAGSTLDIVEVLVPVLGRDAAAALIDKLNILAQDVHPVEAVPLERYFADLSRLGLRYGIATNDSEAAARANLRKVGVEELVEFIVGYDSGHGAKPGPGMCNAFLEHAAIEPGRAAMVGDSLHDIEAGRAAGMQTIAVLTGTASREDLAPHADIVLNHIGEILDWL